MNLSDICHQAINLPLETQKIILTDFYIALTAGGRGSLISNYDATCYLQNNYGEYFESDNLDDIDHLLIMEGESPVQLSDRLNDVADMAKAVFDLVESNVKIALGFCVAREGGTVEKE